MSSSESPCAAAHDAPTGRTVTCPQCGGPSLYAPSNPYRPFCSKRCKQIDLGAWANEDYRVHPTSSEATDDPGMAP
ncbi:DNA gyrase inhibitor YacG [Brachymonas sp.]|uniref:DNA gyrase inhibitor YacG n=1 Tax=unclassified Brachymonas TaxID=2621329 RepID=UPI0035AE1744